MAVLRCSETDTCVASRLYMIVRNANTTLGSGSVLMHVTERGSLAHWPLRAQSVALVITTVWHPLMRRS